MPRLMAVSLTEPQVLLTESGPAAGDVRNREGG